MVPGCCLLIVLSRQSRCVHRVDGDCLLCVTGVVACVNPYLCRVWVVLLQSCSLCLEVVLGLWSLVVVGRSCQSLWEMRALMMVWLFVARV